MDPKRRFTEKPELNPAAVWGLAADHPAMMESRTLFPSTVVEVTEDAPDRLFVSGVNNRKLGAEVTKGRFKGYALYGLSLEERATCPGNCPVRDVCYGNGMQMARRHRIGDEDVFFERMASEIADLAINQHPNGVLFRLHVLGDFPNVGYVAEWADVLEEYPNVAVYGYTARMPSEWEGDEIGDAIEALKQRFPDRFRIRTSGGPADDMTDLGGDWTWVLDHVPDQPKIGNVIVCPAQTDATACCASCGLCWEPASADKAIAFVKHGRQSAEQALQVERAAEVEHQSEDATFEGAPVRRIQPTQTIKAGLSLKDRVGVPPEIRTVNPADLFIEGAYQRDLTKKSMGLIRKIVTEWSWAKFKPPICAECDAGLVVIDGQHTAIGAVTLGIESMPVLIAPVEHIEGRAKSFVAHNKDRIAMTPFEIFHASVTAGDADSVAIAKILAETGTHIPRSAPTKGKEKPGSMIAVTEIYSCYRRDGTDVLRRIAFIAAASGAQMGRMTTRSLRTLLTDHAFKECARMKDSRIANAVKTICGPRFSDLCRKHADDTGNPMDRAGAQLIASELSANEVLHDVAC